MALSDQDILNHLMFSKNIIIDPFERANLATSSYDVRLGEFYFEETRGCGREIYNPWSEKEVRRIWGEVKQALPLREARPLSYDQFEGIDPDDQVILIEPGATILGHTLEFIGGRKHITTKMQARSSWGRNFIEVCKCAGWGDVGFVNRWTMEITNNSQFYTIPLVVGRRIAQIVFFETSDNVMGAYPSGGKYQTSDNTEDLRVNWKPEMMLPKLYLDREVRGRKK